MCGEALLKATSASTVIINRLLNPYSLLSLRRDWSTEDLFLVLIQDFILQQHSDDGLAFPDLILVIINAISGHYSEERLDYSDLILVIINT